MLYLMTFQVSSLSSLVSCETLTPSCVESPDTWSRGTPGERPLHIFTVNSNPPKTLAPSPSSQNSGLLSGPLLKGPINNLTSFLKD